MEAPGDGRYAISSPEDKIRAIKSKADAGGKAVKKSDLLTPFVHAVRAGMANSGRQIIFTEEQWWLYQQANGYWEVVTQRYVANADIFIAYRGYLASQIGMDAARKHDLKPTSLGRKISQILPSTETGNLASHTLRVRVGMVFTKEPGLFWLDSGLMIEDETNRSNPARLAAANGTLGEVVPFDRGGKTE